MKLSTKHIFERKNTESSQKRQNNGKYWPFISEHSYHSFQSDTEKKQAMKVNTVFNYIKITGTSKQQIVLKLSFP